MFKSENMFIKKNEIQNLFKLKSYANPKSIQIRNLLQLENLCEFEFF
jgi:hypothetical protein